MNIIIKETGETTNLKYMVNGVDDLPDLVGNTSDNTEKDEFGNVIMDIETFDWWSKYVNKQYQIDEAINDMTYSQRELFDIRKREEIDNNDMEGLQDDLLSLISEITD